MSFADKFYDEVGGVIAEFPLIPYQFERYYAEMLVIQEQVMRATESLLELAAGEHPYYKHHLEGERGHHDWIANDLRELGRAWFDQPLYPEIAQMVGMQFYHVSVGRPIALMGYLAMMEGYPATEPQVEMLRKLYPSAVLTVSNHAEIDRDHRAELVVELNKLHESDWPFVLGNGVHCAQLYRDALWRLVAIGERHGTEPR
jgi:hypothetical protein